MDKANRDGIQTEIGAIWSLLSDSLLLGDEAKAAIHAWTMTATDREKLSRLVAFLRGEKTFIIEFMRRRLRDGSFPDKVPILLGEMKIRFAAELRKQEASVLFEERKNCLEELTLAF